jgi:hypothetical protein
MNRTAVGLTRPSKRRRFAQKAAAERSGRSSDRPDLDGPVKPGHDAQRVIPINSYWLSRAGVRERRAHRRIAFVNELNRIDPARECRSLAKGQHGKRRYGGGRKNANARLPGGAAQTLTRRRHNAIRSQRDNDAGSDA